MAPSFTVVAAVNDDEVLETSLLASPDLADGGVQVVLQRGFTLVGPAYNGGLDAATGDVVVFIHQDVYLPAGWFRRLARTIEKLEKLDPKWAVAGPFGVTTSGEYRGHVYTTGRGAVLGEPFDVPVPAQTLDEVAIVLRRSSGLRFDESMPGFHLYGTDICQEARAKGLGAYVVSAFLLHNSNGLRFLPRSFWACYFHQRRKWRGQLPIKAPCGKITWFYPRILYTNIVRQWYELNVLRKPVGERVEEPAALFAKLELVLE